MRSHLHKTDTFNYSSTAVLNMFILASVMFLVIYYIVVSNVLTISNYKVGLLNEELSDLIESNGLLTAQKLSIEVSSTMLNFAQSHRMVEARHITHVFESGDIALQR